MKKLYYMYFRYTYLLVQMPYISSTKAMLRFKRRNRKRFLEFWSEKISLQNNITQHVH